MRKRSQRARLKKNLFADLLATDVVQEIETLLGRQAVEELDLEALELAVRQQVLQLAGAAVEQRLNADTRDEQGSRVRCNCGQEARLVGRRSKRVQSVLGPLQLERAYYHCSSCGHGFCPRDEHLGIENTSLSPALTRMVGTVGAMVSFQEGSELLTELAGVAVDVKQVERTAEALGKKSPKTNACTANLWMLFLCRGPCISAWTEREFLYERRNSWAAPANNRTDRRRPGR
jgi:hypothetical protein